MPNWMKGFVGRFLAWNVRVVLHYASDFLDNGKIDTKAGEFFKEQGRKALRDELPNIVDVVKTEVLKDAPK